MDSFKLLQIVETQSRKITELEILNEKFKDMKTEELVLNISALEGEIEKSRRYYNGTVRENNILVETFPSNIIAGMFKFVKSTFFELDNVAERAVPSIKF